MEGGGSQAILREVARALEIGEPVLVVTIISAPENAVVPVGTKMLVRPSSANTRDDMRDQWVSPADSHLIPRRPWGPTWGAVW